MNRPTRLVTHAPVGYVVEVRVTPDTASIAAVPARTSRKATDIVARFAVGIEAVDDGVGSVVIENQHDGFVVFVDGGTLPNGDSERRFGACPDAYKFALSILADIVAYEVSMTGEG